MTNTATDKQIIAVASKNLLRFPHSEIKAIRATSKMMGLSEETITAAITRGRDKRTIDGFESYYGKLAKGYRIKLSAILDRPSEGRKSGLTLLALKAFPSSPLQKMLQTLRG